MDEPLQWQGWWRVSKSPNTAVPLGARSVGYADVTPGWCHGTGLIDWTNIYWGVEGQVGLLADGQRCIIEAGRVAVHWPGMKISGYEVEHAGTYRWMTLDGPIAVRVVEMLGLVENGPKHVGRCPVELFDQLTIEVQDVTSAGEYRASAIAYEILMRAAGGGQVDEGEPKLLGRCASLIEQHCCDGEFTVNSLATMLGVHRSSLSRMFRQARGLTLKDYIHRLRMRRAMSLLRNEAMTIRQVAFACGFSDPAYFSRCVSAELNASPKELRKTL